MYPLETQRLLGIAHALERGFATPPSARPVRALGVERPTGGAGSTKLAHMSFAPLAVLPSSALALLREATRLLLRRPVVGVVAAARAPDGRWVLVRRADTGGWSLPGGTVEWGETIREALRRELFEEAGVELRSIVRTVGVFSRPDRDPRFHAVTVVVSCEVDMPTAPPINPLEIREVALFDDSAVPSLDMGTGDMLAAARGPGPVVLE